MAPLGTTGMRLDVRSGAWGSHGSGAAVRWVASGRREKYRA